MPTGIHSSKEAAGAQGAAGAQKQHRQPPGPASQGRKLPTVYCTALQDSLGKQIQTLNAFRCGYSKLQTEYGYWFAGSVLGLLPWPCP